MNNSETLLKAVQCLYLELPESIAADVSAKAKAVVGDNKKLQEFKEFTHARLDKMGIPTDPGGEHTLAGCRIGDRLDIVEKIHQSRLSNSISTLQAHLSIDKAPGSYYHSWQSNIAMPFHDAIGKALGNKELELGPDAVAFSIHDLVNEAAKTFLDMLIAQKPAERRQLYTMTGEEMVGLLQTTIPPDMEEKPGNDDWDVDMFHNDGGNMVDGDVVVGANVNCRCLVGQLAITQDGSINFYGEDGEGLDRFPYQWKAFQYLVEKGFDLDNILLTESE